MFFPKKSIIFIVRFEKRTFYHKNNDTKMKGLRLLISITICLSAFCAKAQQVKTEFGKNRVQFNHDFREWLQYESPNFIAYWYGPARNVGQAAVQLAEYDLSEIQTLLEHKINTKLEIIVYTDLTDVKQANIGTDDVFNINATEHPLAQLDASLNKRIQSSSDQSELLQGRVNGNKIFVYFDGNHQHLRRQIREGLATIYLNSMLYGTNLQEVVQNAVSSGLPQWYKLGIAAFASEAWNTEMDNALKDIILQPKFEGFKKFSRKNPQLAGHSFWYFVQQTYGRQNMSNLLYLSRINRNIESGFQYILGGNTTKIFESWQTFFKERYEVDQLGKNTYKNNNKIKFKGKTTTSSVKLSPNGKQMAYVTNEAGKCRVYIQDVTNGKAKRIKKTGFYNVLQSTDYNYALIAWKPNGQELSVLFEKQDIRKIYTYNFKEKKGATELLSPDFQRVYSMEYLSNTELALSATTNGFSDIFIYKPIKRTYERITSDFYDDLDVSVAKIKGEKGLVWASNRPDTSWTSGKLDTILPIQNFDIFYLNLEKKERELVQVTNTPLIHERNPAGIDSTYFAYLTDANGIFNRDIAYLDTVFDHHRTIILFKDGARQQYDKEIRLTANDSTQIDTFWKIAIYRTVAFTHPQSNIGRNILAQHLTKNALAADLYFEDNKFKIYVKSIDLKEETTRLLTAHRQIQFYKSNKSNTGLKEKIEINKDSALVKTDPYLDYFQSEFPNPSPKIATEPVVKESKTIFFTDSQAKNTLTESTKKEVHKFRATRVIPYRLKFRTDDISLFKFDNTPILNQPDLFVGGYGTPPLGILSKMTFKELLEDYQVEMGARFSLLISGQFNNLPSSNNNPNSPISGENPTYNSTEYYLKIADKKKQFDKKYTLYHRANNYTALVQQTEVKKSRLVSDVGQFEMTFPFDIYSGIKFSSFLRLDKLIFLSTDSTALNAPSRNEQRIGLRADYIYDNVLFIGNNTPVGTRMKFYAEGMKGMKIQFLGERSFDLSNGYLGILGFDARHYQRIDNRSIIALRATGATSFGTEKMLYMIGGVESALRPPLGSNLAIPEGNYAFLTQAAQMRGFYNNARNGNSMLLLNAEVRIPLIQYIFPSIKASWLKNLQVTGFFDAGTAWQGKKLFSTENPLNTVIIREDPITIKVNYFRDPIIMGTGTGVRTTLFGYFLKFDYAWGIETRVFQAPVKHFSIGLDF